MNIFNRLSGSSRRWLSYSPVYLLCTWLVLGQLPALAEEHEEGKADGRPALLGERDSGRPCTVPPKDLADFANGDRYAYQSLVKFVTQDNCINSAAQVSREAIKRGVSFKKEYPYRFDLYVPATTEGDVNGRLAAEERLKRNIPNLLRSKQVSAQDFLPVLGQVSLLSPETGRIGLAYLAQEQLAQADETVRAISQRQKGTFGKRLAISVLRLGLAQPKISDAFAQNIEQMATLSQADSLKKIFSALSVAATANQALAPAFNKSARALNQGIKKGNAFMAKDKRSRMLDVVFEATRNGMNNEDILRAGLVELNEAMLPLIEGVALSETTLASAWDEVLKILAISPSQTSLARALALSLSPEVIFLPKEDRALVLAAASKHRELAIAVQDNFLLGFNKVRLNYRKGFVKKAYYQRAKRRFFSPWVDGIMDLGPELLTRQWLSRVVRYNLLTDTHLGERFPHLVLGHINESQRASEMAASEMAVEAKVASLAQNMASLWALSQIHIPALQDYIKKHYDN